MLVENLSVPFDRRVWMEATTLRDAGHQVAVICPRSSQDKLFERLDGIAIYRYPLPSLAGIVGHFVEYGIALLSMMALMCVVFLRHGFDVIHTANPPDFMFALALPWKAVRKRFIFDHHDLVPESCLTRWSGPKLAITHRVALWAEHASFRLADVVIATNSSYRDVALLRGAVSPDRVYVVRSGPGRRTFVPVDPCPELREGFDHLVVYLGVMGPNDGLGYLVDAIRHLVQARARRDVLFVLIGDGDVRPALVRRISALGLQESVRFVGRIPDDRVIAYISTADVGVAPDPKDALNDVSTMNKIVEYMALGCPVVSFDLKEARISAAGAGAYVPANDAAAMADTILDLIDDPERRSAMSGVGRRRFAEDLCWERQATQLLAAYQSLGIRPG